MRMDLFTIFVLLHVVCFTNAAPNIIFILADDLGYNDVQWNNDNILTPNMKAMADDGVILDSYYAQAVCSPSRGAFMTGFYPFRLGLAGNNAISWAEKHALPLQRENSTNPDTYIEVETLPEKLKALGYDNYLVGKWHLGYCHEDFTPTFRGFDKFYGFYTGAQNFYTHKSGADPYRGTDLRDNTLPDTKKNYYDTHLFTDKAVEMIQNHDINNPMFLYLAYNAPHTPLDVDDYYKAKYPSTDATRQTFAAMVTAMDEGIKNVTDELDNRGMLSNSIIIFSSDNGGATTGASNYPLRGAKASLFEGGTRVPAFVYSPLMTKKGYRSDNLMHVSDWFPTLVSAAGGTSDPGLDGVNQWAVLKDGGDAVRTEMVYDVDSKGNLYAIRDGDLKLIYVNTSLDANAKIGHFLSTWTTDPFSPSQTQSCPSTSEIRSRATITTLLYNITSDPSECTDLSGDAAYASDLNALITKLESYVGQEIVRPDAVAYESIADPNLPAHGGYFTAGWCTLDSNDQIV